MGKSYNMESEHSNLGAKDVVYEAMDGSSFFYYGQVQIEV